MIHAIWKLGDDDLAIRRPPATQARDRRAFARERAHQRTLVRLRELLIDEFSELAAGQEPADADHVVAQVVERIEEISSALAETKLLHNTFAGGLDRGNRAGLWCITPPDSYLQLPRETPFRDARYFRLGAQMIEVRQRLLKEISRWHVHEQCWQAAADQTLRAHRATLAWVSASVFGGCCDPVVLSRLPETLSNNPVQRSKNVLWVDVQLPTSCGRAANVVGETGTLHRWGMDDLTACVYTAFSRHHGQAFPIPPGKALKKAWLWAQIRALLKDLGIATPGIQSLHAWCLGCWSALERSVTVSFPAYLGEYALGYAPSCSLPPDRWIGLLQGGVAARAIGPPPPQAASTLRSWRLPPLGDKDGGKDANIAATKLLLSIPQASARPPRVADLVRRLEATIGSPELRGFRAAQLLAQWSIELLQKGPAHWGKRLRPSTVRQHYLTPIARTMIAYVEGVDPLDFDETDFEDLYHTVLSRARRADRITPALALQDFHRFLVEHHGCPDLETTILVGASRQQRVRALIVTEAEYRALLHQIGQHPSCSNVQKEALRLAVFLGFRTGMRLPEVLKLTDRDLFQEGTDTVITVRSNRFSRNKTESSRRRIDVRALCNDSEYHWFRDEVSRLHNQSRQDHALLLVAGDMVHRAPITPSEIRCVLQPLLRHVTNNPNVVFHSLRHSALTRIHVTLEEPDLSATLYQNPGTPLSTSDLVSGPQRSMKRLHAVSAIAGHASPDTTLSTYLHLFDVLLQYKVNQALPPLPRLVYAEFLGVSLNRIDRMLRDKRFAGDPDAHTLRRLVLSVIPAQRHRTKNLHEIPLPEDPPARSLDARTIQQILQDHDNGRPVAVISQRANQSTDTVQNVLTAAQSIVSICTRRGKPRLVSQLRQRTHKGQIPLAPALPQGDAEAKLAERMAERLRTLYRDPKHQETVHACIQHFLRVTEANNAGIRVTDIDTGMKVAFVLQRIADNENQVVGIHEPQNAGSLAPSQQAINWRKTTGVSDIRSTKQTRAKSPDQIGALTLTVVLHPKDEKLVSVHSYRYVLHIFAIALLIAGHLVVPSS